MALKPERYIPASKILNYLSILLAIAGALIAILITATTFQGDSTSKNDFHQYATGVQIRELKSSVMSIDSTLSTLKYIKDNNKNIQLAQIQSQLDMLNEKLSNIQNIILDNPEKALSIPLLKQEIEYDKAENEKELSSTKDSIAQVYDINKWIIGLVLSLLISIIVLNISSLLKTKKEA